jgi:hypothetical protein
VTLDGLKLLNLWDILSAIWQGLNSHWYFTNNNVDEKHIVAPEDSTLSSCSQVGSANVFYPIVARHYEEIVLGRSGSSTAAPLEPQDQTEVQLTVIETYRDYRSLHCT